MKRKGLKTLIAAITITMAAATFVGCAAKDSGNSSSNSSQVSGSITAAGSTALQPLAEQAAKSFQDKNSGATINVQGGGSGTGLTQVSQGAVEIGNSDIFAEEKLKDAAKGLVDHKVCVVGFAAVVNSKVNIDNLTQQQLIDIFTGKVTNWKEVGGNDMKITVINRPTSSGTRATFKKYGLNNQEEVQGKALTEDSSGAVKKAIETTDGAIGYLASSYFADKSNLTGIKMLKIDGVAMSKDTITSGQYKIWSYEHMYTKGEATGLTKAFLDYMGSDDVKAQIDKLGYIPTSDMKVQR